MSVNRDQFDVRIKEVLREEMPVPKNLEAVLFSKAEDLLAKRRKPQRTARARRSGSNSIQELLSRVAEVLAVQPDRPATAAIFAVLIAAFFMVQDGNQDSKTRLTYGDLPPLPKGNPFPAQYDAQILAERQAYEREVQNADRRTRGGI